ncbi:peptidase inhibitor family I36 protein [Actinokineospora sp. HUAS TT18]|uniref:peptidase inhibitor family I36 protein n=1 Tax=Actinokineospora sp. HUAS TT18 TaxID=3447451 RepID=UPI003F525B44
MRFREIATIVAVGAAAAVGALACAGTASADQFSCDIGEYCMWEHANVTGDRYTTAGSMASYGTIRMVPDDGFAVLLNNSVSSWLNAGYYSSYYTVIHSYDGANGAGGELWSGGIRQGEAWVGATDNDRAGSHYWRHS